MSNPEFMSVSIVGDRRQIRSLYGKMLQLIQKVYPELEIYFSAEGDGWDAYLTNDKEGRFF